MRRCSRLSIVPLICTALVVGCGGGSSSGAEDVVGTTPAVTTPATTTPVPAASGLSDKTQDKVDEAVDKARRGDHSGAARAAREACVEEAKATLEGDAERAAVEGCESTGAAP